jgi:hypothetical protein
MIAELHEAAATAHRNAAGLHAGGYHAEAWDKACVAWIADDAARQLTVGAQLKGLACVTSRSPNVVASILERNSGGPTPDGAATPGLIA